MHTNTMEEDEDLISLLPDCLLIEIISRLPETKEAIKTVHKTLTQCRQPNLHKFQFRTYCYYVQFESHVNNWIRYAVSCNVQDLELSLWIKNRLSGYVLDQSIFLNSRFTRLKLDGCVFNPIGAISWSKLTSLTISETDLSEDLIENILSGSPLLETLELIQCYGYHRIHITSKSVNNFVFFGYITPREVQDDIIEINAPYIESLTIADELWLSDILLVNVSSLVKADLDFMKGGLEASESTLKEGEEMLKGFIQRLSHVTELEIRALSRLENKGFIFPANLKIGDGVSLISSNIDSDSVELADWSDRDSTESGDSDGDSEEQLDDDLESEGGDVEIQRGFEFMLR